MEGGSYCGPAGAESPEASSIFSIFSEELWPSSVFSEPGRPSAPPPVSVVSPSDEAWSPCSGVSGPVTSFNLVSTKLTLDSQLSWFWDRSLESFFFCSSNWFSNCLTSVSLRWTNCSQFSCFSARSLESFFFCSSNWFSNCLTSVSLRWINCSQFSCFSARSLESFFFCSSKLFSNCLTSLFFSLRSNSMLWFFLAESFFSSLTIFNFACTSFISLWCFLARSLENFSSCSLICSFSCLTSISQLRLFSARRFFSFFSFSTCFNLASTCLKSVSKFRVTLAMSLENFSSCLFNWASICKNSVSKLLFVLKLCSFHLLLQIAVSILQDCHTLKEFFPFSYELFHGLPFPHPQFDDLWVTLQGNIIVLAVRCRLVLLV
ncbi:hypothetical protein F7725_008312 [Dissostichus mawsoni]|uniref:Uncharacterized protein n=1 Tax=Dissostichus mawsoni TaxID=36200 RepID=A0A7J5Y8R9_DISMA|nr:hypothetical protein F7725_008312 [Dissostichus mawsoni]